MPIDIIIVDDHEVVLKGVRILLEDYPEINIIGEARSGAEAIEKITKHKPDVVLLDINMPEMSGLEVAAYLQKRSFITKILLFTMHSNGEYILTGIKNGIDGYILKDANGDEIVKAIKEVYNGNKYFPPSVSAILVDSLQNNPQTMFGTKEPETVQKSELAQQISTKETLVLKLIAEGKKSQEIAEELDLSVRTVSNHRANMLKKTGMNNTYELVQAAINEHII